MLTVERMRELDRELDERHERGQFYEGKGMKNEYHCHDASCGARTVTVLRNAGATPMWKQCPECGADATSAMYRVDQSQPASHEWYRPLTEEEIAEALKDDNEYGGYAEHIERGGLAFREIMR